MKILTYAAFALIMTAVVWGILKTPWHFQIGVVVGGLIAEFYYWKLH